MAIELVGDSARGESFALARLLVDGDRIVEADAPGMERALAGLTLLEAAAVPGETLAADAVANAIGPALRASPDAARVAVAMSGGVDSAVALHRAGRGAIGVTLRLWLDPAGPDAERACCSPDAVIKAREACHALGVPHVTLDLRQEFRETVVGSFVHGYETGLTPNPCMRCNGAFRFAALVAFAERAGAAILWTGHYARIAEREGLRLVARGADPVKDQSYMLATVEPRLLERVAFPLGQRHQGRRSRGGRGRRARRSAPRREPGGVLPCRRRLPRVPRAPGGAPRRRARSSTRRGAVIGRHDGVWRFTPGQRRGLRLTANEPLFALRSDAATNTLVVGPRASLASLRVEARGRLYVAVERAEAKLRYRSAAVGARVLPTEGGFALELDEPVDAVAPGQVAVLYDDDAVVGAGVITGGTG